MKTQIIKKEWTKPSLNQLKIKSITATGGAKGQSESVRPTGPGPAAS